jgi:L-amino acid N-acyltransferase YncA
LASAFTWLARLFGGPFGAVLEQAVAQPTAPLALPARATVGDRELTLRYLEQGDAPAMLAFARGLPPHDLLFLRRDITRDEQVASWLEEAKSGLATTVLALDGEAVVGYATVAADGLTWTRHVRELRVMVGASMRGMHLGRLLTEQAFAVAQAQGAKKMVAQMTVDQRGAIKAFRRLGFAPEARLRGQVIDREGHLHDLQIMTLDVDVFESKLATALAVSPPPN